MQIPLEQTFQICAREIKSRVSFLALGFLLISVVVILIGSSWPRNYESAVTLFADQGRLAGQTLGEDVQNASTMVSASEATELMFSRQVLDRIIEVGGWVSPTLNKREKELLRKTIRSRTDVTINGNLLTISYADPDPRRAYLVASEFADQFIRQSSATSLRASQEAFEFVDQQVKDYQAKLKEADENLKNFRRSVVDASPARKAQSFSTLENLENSLRNAKLELKEAQISKRSLEEQLESERDRSGSSTTASLYRTRLQEMQDELDVLRLSYHDTYPDIQRLKQQIEDMKKSVTREETRYREDKAAGRQSGSGAAGYSDLYSELRSQLARSKTEIQTHQTRISEYQMRMEEEKLRALKMSEGEAQESELNRDYQVNQDYYQELLRRRENARLSMNLALQEAGLSFKVQEKANFPQVPKGLRFLHFVIAGPLLGLIVPIGIVAGLVQVDPRIRSRIELEEGLGLPVLAEISPIETTKGLSKSNYTVMIGAFIGVALLYLVIVATHMNQAGVAKVLGGLS